MKQRSALITSRMTNNKLKNFVQSDHIRSLHNRCLYIPKVVHVLLSIARRPSLQVQSILLALLNLIRPSIVHHIIRNSTRNYRYLSIVPYRPYSCSQRTEISIQGPARLSATSTCHASTHRSLLLVTLHSSGKVSPI